MTGLYLFKNSTKKQEWILGNIINTGKKYIQRNLEFNCRGHSWPIYCHFGEISVTTSKNFGLTKWNLSSTLSATEFTSPLRESIRAFTSDSTIKTRLCLLPFLQKRV